MKIIPHEKTYVAEYSAKSQQPSQLRWWQFKLITLHQRSKAK